MKKQAIGFIDSGVGGLTVVKEAMRQLPNESIYYVGDTARCPYGPRPKEQVLQFTWEMTQFLLRKDIKMLVIACNTATAVALEDIKKKLAIPVIGVILPGSRAAIKSTSNNRVGIIGTEGTVKSKMYENWIHSKDNKVQVTSLACPKFVPIVESNEHKSAIAKKVVAETLRTLKNKQLDTLILGCTHYPLLKPLIQNVMGEEVTLIDSGAETISEVSTILDYFNLAEDSHHNKKEPAERKFYTTGSEQMFHDIASQWLGKEELDVEQIQLGNEERPVENKALTKKNAPEKTTSYVEKKEIVIATTNKGKAAEFESMFGERGYTVKTLLDYPEIPEVEETGETFAENALLKAETIAKRLNRIVLADDSGLKVDFLNGQPGVYSARYAGETKSDAANNAKLLHEMTHAKPEERTAQFHCTLAAAAPNNESLVVEGEIEGTILRIPRGENGFGYDPLFYVPEKEKALAEMTQEEKNSISHRANALKKLEDVWDEWVAKLT